MYTIKSSDYTNLSETFSDKNIINSVSGNEYVISNLEKTTLDERNINPETLKYIFKNYNLENNTGDTPIYNPNIKVGANYQKWETVVGIIVDEGWARTESLMYDGEFEFDTEEVITDVNSLACEITIHYTKSVAVSPTKENYAVQNKTVMTFPKLEFIGGGGFPLLKNEGDNNLSVSGRFLPFENGHEDITDIWGRKINIVAGMQGGQEYCKVVSCLKVSNGYRIKVRYRFRIWGAWTTINHEDDKILSVNSIDIRTIANTVDTQEVPFSYTKPLVNIERNYELDTNELFQSDVDDEEEDKLSYKTYQEISKRFSEDRQIISFDLLNPVAQSFPDDVVYIGDTQKLRYLDNNDIFHIFDEHDRDMGFFRVISSNPVWDGAYHKHIKGILVDDGVIGSFAETGWNTIQYVFQSGMASKYWNVGDTKEVYIGDKKYNVRIVDMQNGRYEYADGSKKTNGVFEFVEVMPIKSKMNETDTNVGGYDASFLRNKTMKTIFDLLPVDLRNIIPSVKVPCYNGESDDLSGIPSYSDVSDLFDIINSENKVFIPSVVELGTETYTFGSGATYYIQYKDGTIFDYYKSDNIKEQKAKKHEDYWLRTPMVDTVSKFASILERVDVFNSFAPASREFAISLFFAI